MANNWQSRKEEFRPGASPPEAVLARQAGASMNLAHSVLAIQPQDRQRGPDCPWLESTARGWCSVNAGDFSSKICKY